MVCVSEFLAFPFYIPTFFLFYTSNKHITIKRLRFKLPFTGTFCFMVRNTKVTK